MSIRLIGIVGMAQDRAIGNKGTMPWHLPEDLKVFKRLTTGHPIVMGRKTYESIGRPLPNRQNIVLSRQEDLQIEGCSCITDLAQLQDLELMHPEVFIIGGAEIYSLALPMMEMMWVSSIEGIFEADTYFPPFEHLFQAPEQVESFEGFQLLRYLRA